MPLGMNRLVTCALLALACGGQTTSAEPVTTSGSETPNSSESEPTPEPERADVFVMAPFTMTDSGGTSISMSADGVVTIPGQPEARGPRFFTNGDIQADGEVIATVLPDGTFRAQNGSVIGVIAEDGSVTIGEHSLSFGPDGGLIGGNPDGPTMTLSPADTPAKRQAMALLILLTI